MLEGIRGRRLLHCSLGPVFLKYFPAFFLGALAVHAQSAATGALEGTVRDPSGTPLAGVSITLTNPATDQVHRADTDTLGNYRFSLLPPAVYEAHFSIAGYKSARMAQVTVNVSEIPVLEASMVPGGADDEIDCLCRMVVSAPSTGTLIDKKTITSVPLNTRNFTQVLSMSSGSAADVNNAGTLGRGSSSVNVNGNTTAGAYTIEGAWAPSTVPSPDAISEFRLQTSQYDAGFGAMVPSTNIVTRGGQNDMHGNMWEFLRNDVFNANAFFRNATGQPKPNLKQNQFGATLGGAAIKNKWFFFGSYQGTRQVNGLDPTSVANLILPALGEDRSAATLAARFCPANHPADSRFLSFAGGRQLDCWNRATSTTAPVNPVALRLLQARAGDGAYLIPSPQTLITAGTNAGLGFSSYSLPSKYNENHFVANTDYVLSSRNTISARFFAASVDQLRTFGSPGGYPGAAIVPGWGASQKLDAADEATSARLTSSFNANRVNELTFAFTRNNTDAVGVETPTAALFGMTPVDPLLPQPPEVTVLGPLGTFRLFGSNPNDNHFQTITYTATDNFSWVRGRQRFRLGGAYLNQYNGRADTGGARGRITFQTFADFLLGLSAADNLSPYGRSNIQTVQANEGIGPFGEAVYRYRRHYGSAYLQDDIKVTSTLTVNLGVRWEYIGPSYDTRGAIGNILPDLLRNSAIPPSSGTLEGYMVAANYDSSLINPHTGKPFGPLPEGVVVNATKSYYRNGTPLAQFAPRAGFAWQPFGSAGRIVVGGGYGWFYQTPAFSANAASAPLFTAPPFSQSFTNTDASNGGSTFEKPFPQTTLGYVPRTLTSQLSDRVAGPEYRIPRLEQWNFSIKARFNQSVSLDAAYVASRGSRLLLSHGLNQPLLAGPFSPVNCGYDGNPANCITENTTRNARSRVPILGETPTALLASEFAGHSWYHSLQTTLRTQQFHGLSFQAAYTLSKALNDTSVFNDQNSLEHARARASFDRTHRLIANFDYQLPSLSRGSTFGAGLFRGWSVSGIVIVQSGLPMTLTDPSGGAVFGRAGTSTVTLCPGATYASLQTPGGTTDRLGRWIETSAICPPVPVGSDGATGYGTAGQGILNGPSQVNTDFSLGKRSRVGGIREDAELAFRVEFYNALNHPQFANPGTTFGTATFGVITQSSVAPRLIQFGIKYLF